MRDVAIVFVQFVGIVIAYFVVLFAWFAFLIKSSDAMLAGVKWLEKRGRQRVKLTGELSEWYCETGRIGFFDLSVASNRRALSDAAEEAEAERRKRTKDQKESIQ